MAKKGRPHHRPGPPDAVPLRAPERGVTVRMYRQGLGDCFLLTFPGREGEADKAIHMLIDCGVHAAQKGGSETLKRIVRDLHQVTGGHLDVVVATHEHTDHLSGFLLMEKLFGPKEQFTIGQLWLGWTEDRDDELANSLRTKHGHTLAALRAALKQLRAKHAAKRKKNGAAREDPSLERLAGLTQFFGARAAGDGLGTNPDDVAGPELALDWLRQRARETVIHRPGPPVVQIDGVPGARVYVLGPPHDADALGVEDPREKGNETYQSGLQLNASTSFSAAVISALTPGAMREEDTELQELTYPFDQARRNGLKNGRITDPWLREHHAAPEDDWRTVDDDWLHAAEGLALALDSDTNNTSLALAIELVESGDVLLFAADAQYGNWNTWRGLQWKVDGETVRAEDLLERAVFYKVGHHASHNGTLRENGLEKMGDDLVGMIPVDQASASKLKGWKMPHKPLYKRLLEKTGGRLFRSDRDCPLLVKGAKRPPTLSIGQWKAFQSAVQTSLYFEMTFPTSRSDSTGAGH